MPCGLVCHYGGRGRIADGSAQAGIAQRAVGRVAHTVRCASSQRRGDPASRGPVRSVAVYTANADHAAGE